MANNLRIKLINGETIEAILVPPFDPRRDEVETICGPGEIRLIYPLTDISYLLLADAAVDTETKRSEEQQETVTTTAGETFTIHPSDRDGGKNGFFGIPQGLAPPFNLIFFTNHGLRQRSQSRPIGNILKERGLVQDPQIREALREQEKLRTRRIGEILSESGQIARETLELTLQDPAVLVKVPAKARVGDILIAAGLVTRAQVEEALATQEAGKRKRVGELLIEKGLITEDQLLSALAAKFNLQIIDLETVSPSLATLRSLSQDLVTTLQVLPIELRGRTLVVATSQPTDPTIADTLRFHTNCSIEMVVAPSREISAAIDRCYAKSASQVSSLISALANEVETVEEEQVDSKFSESDSQIIKLVNTILIEADRQKASDIHFEPGPGSQPMRVRYRIDGICRIAHQIAAAYKYAIIARIKIISKLDIAEHRRPQSGKILLRAERRAIEYRVEITPTVGAQEDAVLRILSNSKPLALGEMNFTPENLKVFRQLLVKPYGIILCVGPTGSGKTTTLHSALAYINKPDKKIWTAEDPVEITQAGLRQVQVNAKIGFNFPDALRSFLRGDPDVIMIGEMRDVETAKAAIEASLTGHLVFSTLHTNSASETAVRLIEMGMDPFNFANAVLGILAQRLARRLCTDCKASYHPAPEEYAELVERYGADWFKKDGLPGFDGSLTLHKAVGCKVCEGSGYRGRIAIHELLPGGGAVRDGIKHKLPADELEQLALSEGMRTLKMDGIRKIFEGQTDLLQILKVCM